MKWLTWSLKALLSGFHPMLDPDNNEFTEDSVFYPLRGQQLSPTGHRCVLWSIQGDHEFFSNVLQLPHWNNAEPCWECNCKQKGPSDVRI